MKVRNILIIILACFVLVPVVAFSIVSNIMMSETAKDEYLSVTSDMAQSQATSMSFYFDSLKRIGKTVSQDGDLVAYLNSQADTTTMENAKKVLDTYTGLAGESNYEIERVLLMNNTGTLLMNSGDDITVDGTSNKIQSKNLKTALTNLWQMKDDVVCFYNPDAFGIEFSEDDKEKKDPIFPSSSSGNLHLVVKQTIGDNAVLVFYNDVRFKTIMTQASFTTNSRMILIDPHGSIYDTSYVGNLTDENRKNYQQFKDNSSDTPTFIKDAFGNGSSSVSTISYSIQMPNNTWSVTILAESDRAYSNVGDATGKIVGVIIFVGILALVGNILIVYFLTKPLNKIGETLTRIRRGDHEARIDVVSNNEYGEISRAFNDLIDDIVVSEGRYRTIIEMSDNIIFEWNFSSNEVIFSNNFNKKFSYRAPSDHFGDSFLLKVKVHPDDSERYRKDLERLSKGEEFKQNEYRWKNIYGDYIWILMRTATIRDREGNIIKVVGVIVDIDRAKKSEKLLTARASYDSLTQLYNRETIERTIDNEIDLINVRKNEFAILFIDIDDFKIFNDKYSHATGDQVLKFVANTITHVTDGFGIAGRYGGDEFVCCIRNAEINEPGRVAKDILNGLREGFVCDSGEKLTVNASIGISLIKDSNMRVDEIIGLADDAMYKIKKSGKSDFGFLNKPVDRANIVTVNQKNEEESEEKSETEAAEIT